MTFLEPMAGIVWGAAAAPILIALYLLKLRRRTLRVSTIMFWESAVRDVQANVPLRWIKPSWLLALQALALACVLIAIARPAVPSTTSADDRTIVVIDRSASMSARDGSGPAQAGEGSTTPTRLDQAKRQAIQTIEQFARAGSTRPQVMGVALAADAQILQPYTSDLRRVREAIESIEPTDQPVRLDDAIRLASAGVDAGETHAQRTTLLLFSDGGMPPSDVALPASVRVRLVPSGASGGEQAGADNLGIVALSARRDADQPSSVRVFVRVLSVRTQPSEVTLTCTVDGEPGGLLPLIVPAATRDASGTLIPGEAGGTLVLDRPEGGLVVVSIPRSDLLEADNAAAVVVRPASRPRILVVGPDDTSDPLFRARGEKGVDRFLLGALGDLEPSELRVLDAGEYASAYGQLGQSAARIDRWDLVVFDRVAPALAPPVPAMFIGAAPPMRGLSLQPIPREQWPEAATRIISWRRTHPILRYAALDSVLISPPMRMTIADAPAAIDATQAPPAITPLAFGSQGPVIALVEEPGPKRLRRLVLAFDLLRTNWGPEVSFPIFVASAIDALTGRGEAASGVGFTTGEPVSIITPPGVQRVRITGPEARTIDVIAPGQEGGVAPLGVPRLVGVYRAEADGFAQAIPVNLLDASASTVRTRTSIEIADRVVGDRADEGRASSVREIWFWFVLCACVVLGVEWFVYAWRVRS